MQKIVEKCVKTSCRILERFNVNKLNATQLNNFNFTNNEWWSLNGKFKALHSMNKLRVGLIRQLANSSTFDKQNEVFKLAESYPIKSQNFSSDLKNVNILDVGCGAGILSEPLARLGGNVIGIDSDDSAIKNAKNHILDTFINSPQYFNTKVENFLKIYLNHVKSKQNIDKPKILPSLDNHLFDFVVLSEVIEHVDDPGLLIWEASKYLKKGGFFVLTTLNRTVASYLFCIEVAEKVLKIVPQGLHDWNKFMTPDELTALSKNAKLNPVHLHGMCYNFITNDWNWTTNFDMNYCFVCQKE